MSSASVGMRLRHLMVQAIFQPDTFVGPTNVWCALTYDVVPVNGYGPIMNEPLVGDYDRVQIPLTSANWKTTGYGEVVNAGVILFPEATFDWGYLQGWALMSTAEAFSGEVLASGGLHTPVYVPATMQPALAPSSIGLGLLD